MTTTKQTHAAPVSVGLAILLSLSAAYIMPGAPIDIGGDGLLAGVPFQVFGAIDPATVATSPNKVPIYDKWTPPAGGTSSSWPTNASPYPQFLFIRGAGTGTGNLYVSGEIASFASTPPSTALPMVGALFSSPMALPGASTMLMLDQAATAADSVEVWTGESDMSGYSDTSASSVVIGLGTKTFAASTGKSWKTGDPIRVSNAAGATDWMQGTVATYTTGTGALVVNVTSKSGTGTVGIWVIRPTQPIGFTYRGRLHGGGQSLVVTASYVQIQTIAKPNATYLFAAGLTQGAAQTPLGVGMSWVAATGLVDASRQCVPPCALSTVLSSTIVYGVTMARAGSLSHLEASFVGDATNVAGQTVAVKLMKSAAGGGSWLDVAGAVVTLAATAGNKSGSVDFTAVPYAAGDIFALSITPSAILTAPVTSVSGAAC